MLLPARMAVLNRLSKVERSSVEEMMEALKKDYGNERQFNYEAYLEHMMALEANGYASLQDYKLMNDGRLSMYYSITDDGRDSVKKYIPDKFK